MKLDIYQVDAFTDRKFGGNPAAICPLSSWLSDEEMQAIAMENNLSETAFFVLNDKGYDLRWFTPETEVNLCGHATLAAAHVLFQHLGIESDIIIFQSKSGPLTVRRLEPNQYLMDFPSDHADEVQDSGVKKIINDALNLKVTSVWKGKDDYMALIASESDLRNISPDFSIVNRLPSRGLVVTAEGEDVDFVSRGFFPQAGINEDPATGSAHTMLTPFWSMRLRKNNMTAHQISSRLGQFQCVYKGSRVALIGQAVSYMQGTIWI